MSNREWDKKSYNQSHFAELERLKRGWEELLKERPIEDQNYQAVEKHDADHHEKTTKGSDVY